MDRITKVVASGISGVVAAICYVLFLFPTGCNDVGGVPSWERCTTLMGTPAFSVEDFGWDNTLDVIPPVLIGLLVGFLAWWLMGALAQSADETT